MGQDEQMYKWDGKGRMRLVKQQPIPLSCVIDHRITEWSSFEGRQEDIWWFLEVRMCLSSWGCCDVSSVCIIWGEEQLQHEARLADTWEETTWALSLPVQGKAPDLNASFTYMVSVKLFSCKVYTFVHEGWHVSDSSNLYGLEAAIKRTLRIWEEDRKTNLWLEIFVT